MAAETKDESSSAATEQSLVETDETGTQISQKGLVASEPQVENAVEEVKESGNGREELDEGVDSPLEVSPTPKGASNPDSSGNKSDEEEPSDLLTTEQEVIKVDELTSNLEKNTKTDAPLLSPLKLHEEEQKEPEIQKKPTLSPLFANAFSNFRNGLQKMQHPNQRETIIKKDALTSPRPSTPKKELLADIAPTTPKTTTETPLVSPKTEMDIRPSHQNKKPQTAEGPQEEDSNSTSESRNQTPVDSPGTKQERNSPGALISLANIFSKVRSSSSLESDGKVSGKDLAEELSIADLTIPELNQNKDKESPTGSTSLLSSFKVGGEENDKEEPHCFEVHTFRQPTNCDVCEGLLVGLWCQGLQCKQCGLNVHRGEGVGGHDDCRAEALLTGCCQRKHIKSSSSEQPVQMSQVIQQFRQLAKEKPNFLRDAKAQLDRDINSRVKEIVVSKGTEEEKTKKLLRARTVIVPFVQLLDSIEHRGLIFIYSLLCFGHLVSAALVSIISWIGFYLVILLLPNNHGSASDLAWFHTATVVYSYHAAVVVLVIMLRRLVNLVNRKSNLLDQFLETVLRLQAEADLGISVNGVANRAKLWVDRTVVTSSSMCLLALGFWHVTTQANIHPSNLSVNNTIS